MASSALEVSSRKRFRVGVCVFSHQLQTRRCDKEIKSAAFAKAIATEESKPVSERIDMAEIPLDSSCGAETGSV